MKEGKMYIVRILIGDSVVYFNGQYMRGLYQSSETLDKAYATKLTASQAHEVGMYYQRMYMYRFELERAE